MYSLYYSLFEMRFRRDKIDVKPYFYAFKNRKTGSVTIYKQIQYVIYADYLKSH